MLSLKTIGKRDNVTTVTLRGAEVTVRGLSAWELAEVEAAWPRPSPPMVPDPDRGDLAPKIPDLQDAGYRAAFGPWHARTTIAHAAVSMDWRVGEGEQAFAAAPDKSAWCRAAVSELDAAGFTREEVLAVTEAAERLERGEGARKNS